MSDEKPKLSKERRIALGNEAKRLLDDELFNGVLNELLRAAIVELMGLTPGTPEATAAHATLQSLDRIKGQLRGVANDGIMAAKDNG